MSETNNVDTQNEELMKHTKAELVELLLKEERKVAKHKKEKAELRVQLKEGQEEFEEAVRINTANENYLQELARKLNQTEMYLQNEGQTLQEVITSLSESFDSIELGIKLARKALQFNLMKGEEGKKRKSKPGEASNE